MRKLFSSKRPKESKDRDAGPQLANDGNANTTPNRSKSPHEASKIANEILGGIKYTLKLSEAPLRLLPIPLLPEAVEAILQIIAAFEGSSINKRQMEILRDHIQNLMTHAFNPIVDAMGSTNELGPVSLPSDLQQRLETLSKHLIRASQRIEKLSALRTVSSVVHNEDIAMALRESSAMIDSALQEFQLGGQITTELLVRQLHAKMLDQAQKDLLDKLPFAPAEYSNTKTKASECLEDTRTQLLQDIRNWIETESHTVKPSIFMSWLCGIPGAGKSTVAMTIAKYLDDNARLGASFFFSRDDNECNNSANVMPTIARQLAFFNPTIANHATEFLKTHPDFGSAVMSLQLEKLIIEPIKKAHDKHGLAPFVIVLDALDECANSAQAQKLLDLLATEFRKLPFPVLLFITSRPEFHLASKFTSSLINPISSHIMLHDIDNVTVTMDITRYLEKHLGTVASEHPRAPKDRQWPEPKDIQLLARRASGLFIYAVTTVAFVANPRSIPENQLQIVLNLKPQSTFAKQKPYELIDALYLRVLHDACADPETEYELAPLILTALGTIVTLVTPLPYHGLLQLLDIEDEILYDVLTRLTSVIHYDPRKDDDSIRVMHQSFPDFLARCNDCRFKVDAKEHHARLAQLCLRVLLSDSLKRGMCAEATPSRMNSEIPNIQSSILPHLGYASLYLTSHLEYAEGEEIQLQLVTFLKTKLLNWFEALSLLGRLDTAITSLKHIEKWHTKHLPEDTHIAELILDAQRFVHQFFDPISQSAVHVYHSALVFAPECTLLELYRSELRFERIELNKGRDHRWGSCLRTIEGHRSAVNCVALSSDNLRIASASSDETVRVWDAISGAPQATLEGHSATVRAVTFNSDDSQIISGSEDNTIRFWDSTSGALLLTIDSPMSSVFTIALSSDDVRLVSGGSDNAVRVWDARSGELQATLEGHIEAVLGVAVSSDNSLTASGSNDRTVRLWDMATFSLLATLEGHLDWVKAVAFSPDGLRLASAACDKNIILWNTKTFSQEAVYQGHTDWVRALKFSYDGGRLVSGASDNTVRTWDTRSGQTQATFEGHGKDVITVCFSSDGSQIVSGSSDKMIRVWDATSGTRPTSNTQSQTDGVLAVAFSSDNNVMVSGLKAQIAQVWDATSGTLIHTLSGHSNWVWAVAFSSDDRRIATGSKDNTARVWGTETGNLITCLQGHTAWIWSIAFTSDGASIVTGSGDRSTRIWDSQTGAVLAVLSAESTVTAVGFSPDDTRAISGFATDATVRIWQVKSQELQAICKGHSGFICSAVSTHDNSKIVSHSLDKTIRMWDASTGAELRKWEDAELLINESYFLDRFGWICRISDSKPEKICWIPISLRKFCRYGSKNGSTVHFKTTHENNVGGTMNTSILFSIQ